jgi:ribosomal protein L11 methyltransferase
MENTAWLEISITVDGEMAEAVSEVLTRYIPNGVAIESTAVTANPDDSDGHAIGPLRVYGYLKMDETLEAKRRQIEEALWYLGRIRPLPPAEFRSVQETDWAEAWKQHYHPILIGKRLVIVPAWMVNPQPERIEIRMDPGMAFGTGTHPTTQLCLEYLEEIPQELPRLYPIEKQSVIDIGCGSGILSVAAIKLGFKKALGVDIDADSVRISRENALMNGVSQELETGFGSVAEILRGDFSLQQAPVVVANILAPVIVRLLDEDMGKLVQPDGVLILSGIIESQAEEVESALRRNAMYPVGKKQILDWVSILAARDLPSPRIDQTDPSATAETQ